jgi:hypothetical protein
MKVYVSSTSKDLHEFRAGVIRTVLDLEHHPVAMENYGARTDTPVEKCLNDVRSCDLYVLLVAYRYGLVPQGYDHSITDLEYQESVKSEKLRLVFVVPDEAPWPQANVDDDKTRIRAFRDHILNNNTAAFFGDESGLVKEVATAIANYERELLQRQSTVGDIDSDKLQVSIAHLPLAPEHFVGREEELARLDAAWEDADTNVISLVAFGGVGKSALVGEWLNRLKVDKWRGATHVLGHSFYSQGSREDAQASADSFINEALEFFDDEDPTAGSPWDKGERLARLVRGVGFQPANRETRQAGSLYHNKTLLILDGMEPLQYGPTSGEPGHIKDTALQALVRELAVANSGLCVITTREKVADLPKAPVIDLEQLSNQAGAALLAALGVLGSQEDLENASRDVAGHGLALTLLGNFLRKAFTGEIERLPEIELWQADQRQGGHARKLMEKYERWLGDGPELSILRLLGLFDRPAEADCLAVLRREPAIAGLTEVLVNISEENWNWSVSNLVDCGLSRRESASSKPQFLDAHLLVREYFAEQLNQHHPAASKEAHRRLYEHLKQSAPDQPDSVRDMMTLYHAVRHGCAGNLHKETFEDTYWARIQRNKEGYATRELGLFSADFAALHGFFEERWAKPKAFFTGDLKGLLPGLAGQRLRALGRPRDAIKPLVASYKEHLRFMDGYDDEKNDKMACEQARWASLRGRHLSELHLTLGEVDDAINYGQESVILADASGHYYQRFVERMVLATAHHHRGETAKARGIFREAEEILRSEGPEPQAQLYSLWGFRYCELLLDEAIQNEDPGAISEVQKRAASMPKWCEERRDSLIPFVCCRHGRITNEQASVGGRLHRGSRPGSDCVATESNHGGQEASTSPTERSYEPQGWFRSGLELLSGHETFGV